MFIRHDTTHREIKHVHTENRCRYAKFHSESKEYVKIRSENKSCVEVHAERKTHIKREKFRIGDMKPTQACRQSFLLSRTCQ